MPAPAKALATAVMAAALAFPTTALAHQGNPNFRSTVTAAVPGVKAEVLDYDADILLRDTGHRDVLVRGYEGEPYFRIKPDGTVQVNRLSPAYYLNEERYGAPVPKFASAKATPQWKTIDKTGRFQWHDHRTHWMSKTTPPQVKDKHKRTHIFDWKLPLTVDGQPATIRGTLFWVGPTDSKLPIGAIVGLLAILLAAGAFVVTVRRRRGLATTDGPAGDGGESAEEREKAEAW